MSDGVTGVIVSRFPERLWAWTMDRQSLQLAK